jgi:hypothetical protein
MGTKTIKKKNENWETKKLIFKIRGLKLHFLKIGRIKIHLSQ